MERTCTSCNETKTLQDYYFESNKKGGKRPRAICKPCHSEYNKNWEKNNKDKGTYDWEKDTIFIRPTGYKSVEDFIITILHEIHHAKRVHRYGLDKFLKKYQQAGQVADFLGKDRYFSNKWEKKAEGWAKHEYKRYFKDKFFDV